MYCAGGGFLSEREWDTRIYFFVMGVFGCLGYEGGQGALMSQRAKLIFLIAGRTYNLLKLFKCERLNGVVGEM